MWPPVTAPSSRQMSSRRISQSCTRALLPGFMADLSEKPGLLGNSTAWSGARRVVHAIEAIDSAANDEEEIIDQLSLMTVSEHAYTEIFENLSQPGYEHVLVGESGEIDLKNVRLIRVAQRLTGI